MFFVLSSYEQISQASDVIHDLYLKLNTQAVKLNQLINHYQIDAQLEISEQENFATTLIDFKNEIQQLAIKGIDIALYEKEYVAGYEAWAQKIIDEPTLLEEIANAGQPVQQVSKPVAKMTELYEDLQTLIFKNQKEFESQIQLEINSLNGSSIQSQNEFLKLLHYAFSALLLNLQSAKTATKNAYFNFLTEQNVNFNIQNLTLQDKKFLQGVNDIVQNVIIYQRAFMLDITSSALRKNRIINLQNALKNAQLLDDQTYQAQLKINEKGLQLSWTQELKDYIKDFLQDFSKEFKKELINQTNKAILHVGGRIGGEIGKTFLKSAFEGLGAELANFEINLSTESLENFFKDLSPAARAVKSFIRVANPIVAPSADVMVKTDISLCSQEQIAVSNRMKKIKSILKAEFNIDQPLRMAFCCSGGGVRAMVGAMGIFQAAARFKVLQSSLYMAGLSGSTWMIAPWSYLYLQNKLNQDYEKSLQQMVDNWKIILNDPSMVQVGSKVYTPANLTGKQASIFASQVALRLAYGLPITAVDVYGAMVGNFALKLIGNNQLTAEWSSIAHLLENGDLPFPLCSAVFNGVLPENRFSKNEYEWCEISPCEVGGTKIGYIPLQYLGSTFLGSKLDVSDGQLRPEYPLSYLLGIFGSAFSMNLNDVINKVIPSVQYNVDKYKITLPIDMWVRSTLDETFGKKGRFKRGDSLYALFSNYSVEVHTLELKLILFNCLSISN